MNKESESISKTFRFKKKLVDEMGNKASRMDMSINKFVICAIYYALTEKNIDKEFENIRKLHGI